jgi:pimeloyl-ACP methyl ester carboxylesterase
MISCQSHVLPGQLLVLEVWFEVPLNYDNQEGPKLRLFGRIAQHHEKPIVSDRRAKDEARGEHLADLPYMVFLAGGPGFGNTEPQDSKLTRPMLSRGYQVLYLDYRGTGLSTPVTSETLKLQGTSQQQADYLKFFRADNIVRDLEAVRRRLFQDVLPEKQSWSLFGQSFGGFVSLSYLSKFGPSLEEVFMTGGLAPVGKTPDDVYAATWKKVSERNDAYYHKFPEDITRVHDIVSHIRKRGPLSLPAGGRLTVPRFLGIGISFGSHGGLDQVHALVLRMHADLAICGYFTRPTLHSFEGFSDLDICPIYAILHEAIYCGKGVASNWAAYRTGKEIGNFSWLADETLLPNTETPIFFSGEMIFRFNFDDYEELRPMKAAAEILANFSDWDDSLYDEKALARNRVPVYAASYVDDMYVDFKLAQETAKKVRGIKVWETNSLYHNAVRSKPEELLPQLFRMRDDAMD